MSNTLPDAAESPARATLRAEIDEGLAEMPDAPRWLALQSMIDYLYFELDQLRRTAPKSPIDKAIDDATGNTDARIQRAKAIAAEMKRLKGLMGQETGETYPTDMEEAILALGL